ncbi:MAG: redoxin domain-containing protein [Solirubrobacteraceae bacterium]
MTRKRLMVISAGVAAVAALVAVTAALSTGPSRPGGPRSGLESNPSLDPGTPVHGPAPGFTLTDQFGRRVSLRSYRGKVVILAFVDSRCTNVCPLTTTAILDAGRLLRAAGSEVQLLGIDANPAAARVTDVRAYSRAHQMTNEWHFLTGPLPQLERVWRAYGIEARVVHGQIEHTPAVYVIDREGRLSRLYMTQTSYASVDQLGQLLARSASSLLPGHPRVPSTGSYAEIPAIDPGTPVTLPRAGGGAVRLGPGGSPHLLLFFDTWDSGMTNLGAQLDALNRYQSAATGGRLPPLIAVDEGSVEPSSRALPRFLHGLRGPLAYPVAIDPSGRVADGYRVQDEPWFELISASGQFLWYHDVSTAGWPGRARLVQRVRAALAKAPKAYPLGAAGGALAGSPAALASLHAQAGQLLGSASALATRIRALRGYPIVLNAWASWCTPCQQEFPLFASASKRYGTRVAFLGANTNDSPGDARSFLHQHPVGYPSYPATTSSLSSLAVIEGLPTTVFINRAGKVISVHTGQYSSQTALDGDIERYALGR